MQNSLNASYSCLEVAESDVRSFAKLHGYAVSRARSKKSKTGEILKVCLWCVHGDTMGNRKASYEILRRSKLAVHGRLLFKGSKIQNTHHWVRNGTLWLETANIMNMITLLMHQPTRGTERLIPRRRRWLQHELISCISARTSCNPPPDDPGCLAEYTKH